MKIALLYSGCLRNLSETIHNNLNYFREISNDIDLYFSTWDHIGYVDRINSPDFIFAKRLFNNSTPITEKLITDIVPKNTNIKKIKIEKYVKNNYKLNLINGTNDSLNAQFYKIYDCYSLIDDIYYDMVARLRCDILLKNSIDRKYLINLLEGDKIVFPSKIWYNYTKQDHIKLINDMMWITNKKLIKKSCNTYNNSTEINKIILERKQNDKNFGESICYMNLEAEGIAQNIHTFDFDYNILR